MRDREKYKRNRFTNVLSGLGVNSYYVRNSRFQVESGCCSLAGITPVGDLKADPSRPGKG